MTMSPACTSCHIIEWVGHCTECPYIDKKKSKGETEMKKEEVLKVEIKQVWENKWAWRIIFKNEKALSAGGYTSTELYPFCENELLDSFGIEVLKGNIARINEKYGIVKQWRARRGEQYYYIASTSCVLTSIEFDQNEDRLRFEFGNYFATKKGAKEAADKINQFLEENKQIREYAKGGIIK